MVSGRAVTAAGLCALAAGVVLILALHVMPPTNEISPLRRTLSQYALGPGKWIFDVAVLLVALGSALAFAELIRRRLVRPFSVPVVLGGLWVACLLVVVSFTKTNWTIGPSIGGVIHRYASVVGFLALPLAVLLVAGTAFADAPGWRFAARTFGVLALSGLGVLFVGVLRMLGGGGPWWLFVPLGLVERMMALAAVAAIGVVLAGLLANSRDAVPVPA
ncbi:MAG TPA: DUF998 domain-containing protein [Actinophytocola sp.]|jgi:hypothetical protein|nr:DUF998 domain-containing protein [Actinophytocola sp.]